MKIKKDWCFGLFGIFAFTPLKTYYNKTFLTCMHMYQYKVMINTKASWVQLLLTPKTLTSLDIQVCINML